jgi:hypothetical protein
MSKQPVGTVQIKPHKKLFLQEKEEEDALQAGEMELNPLFLSTHVASTDYDQIKQLKLPNKSIAKSANLGFVQFLQRIELPNNKLKNIHVREILRYNLHMPVYRRQQRYHIYRCVT